MSKEDMTGETETSNSIVENKLPRSSSDHHRRKSARGGDPPGGYAPLSIDDGTSDDGDEEELISSLQIGEASRLSSKFVCCTRRRRFCCFAILIAMSIFLLVTWIYHPSLLVVSTSWFRNKKHRNFVCLPMNKTTTSSFKPVHPTQLDLNRETKKLKHLPRYAHDGFLWNDEDASTQKWRPQGVTVATLNHTAFALISWYGRADQGYENRGARISLVDLESRSYRHVLLVDPNYCTMPSLHAGGLVYRQGKLHVPDSRDKSQIVRFFDVETGIYQVNQDDENRFFGYRYIVVQESQYEVPTVPSFLSYNANLDMMVVGTYAHCSDNVLASHDDSLECRSRLENRLAWKRNADASDSPWTLCTPYFSEMQGVAVAQSNENNSELVLWVVSSYGPVNDSHLHIVAHFDEACQNNESTWAKNQSNGYKVVSYPPGLEDLHIEEFHDLREMWMLTEFKTRAVFVVDLDKLMP